eukprot:m.161139 g.161139  ORF g.161139 m.161139 type:complete len:58 (+) comp14360_c2_seq2:45-218(+)
MGSVHFPAQAYWPECPQSPFSNLKKQFVASRCVYIKQAGVLTKLLDLTVTNSVKMHG